MYVSISLLNAILKFQVTQIQEDQCINMQLTGMVKAPIPQPIGIRQLSIKNNYDTSKFEDWFFPVQEEDN